MRSTFAVNTAGAEMERRLKWEETGADALKVVEEGSKQAMLKLQVSAIPALLEVKPGCR